MLKILMVSFALLCLGACSAKDSPETNNLLNLNTNFKSISQCISHIGMEKPLVAEEAEGVENVAVLTNSNNKTHIHLDSIGGFCKSNIKIKNNYTVDTLKLEEYWDENEGRLHTGCSCILSLDLTLESKYDDVKYLVYTYYHGSSQIFPVIYK